MLKVSIILITFSWITSIMCTKTIQINWAVSEIILPDLEVDLPPFSSLRVEHVLKHKIGSTVSGRANK